VEDLGPPEEGAALAPASLLIRLPRGATLTVNNKVSRSTSTTRKFVTPPLRPGTEASYALKVEFPRGESTVTLIKRVTVRAGEETTIELGAPAPGEQSVIRARQDD